MTQLKKPSTSVQDSAVHLHLQDKGHSFQDSTVHILDSEEGLFKRGVKEQGRRLQAPPFNYIQCSLMIFPKKL